MTDKTPIERLRDGLTARGVEWWNDAGTWWKVGDKEYHAWQFDDERLCMSTCYLTPEQAIAATVGGRTDLSDRLREVHGLHAFAELFGFCWADDSDWTWHDVACAIADAVDAVTVGNDLSLNTDGSYKCPECGCVVDYDLRGDGERIISMDDYVIPFNHCPKCGAKVEVG